MPVPDALTPLGAKSLLESCVEALLQVPYWKLPSSELQGLPDVGANKILERVIEERPQFYPGILERFSQAVTQIHFENAVPPYQMLRILLALLEFRYIFKLTIASLRQNCSILGLFPDHGIQLISLHLPNCNPGKQSLGFLQGMTSLEELNLSGSDLRQQPLLSHVLYLTCLTALDLSCTTLHEQDTDESHCFSKLVSLEYLNVAEARARKNTSLLGWQQPIEFVNTSVLGFISQLTRLTYLDISTSFGTYIPPLPSLQVLVMDGSTLVPPGQPGVKQKFLTHLSLRNTVVQPEARASLHAIVDDSSESLRELVLVSSRSCIHIWEGLLSRATSLQSLTLGGSTDWDRLAKALVKLTTLRHLEILMGPIRETPPVCSFFLPQLTSLSYHMSEVCAISNNSSSQDWQAPELRHLILRAPGFYGKPGQQLIEWAPNLTYLAFDWEDRKLAEVDHYPVGNAESQEGFPLDPSCQLAATPMADLMENIPRLRHLRRLDIKYTSRALKLANIVGMPKLRELHIFCTVKNDEGFSSKEHNNLFKMASGILTPGNPQLALVTYNDTVVWPQRPRGGQILFTQTRTQCLGSEDLHSPDDIAYSREELLQLRPTSSPQLDLGMSVLSRT